MFNQWTMSARHATKRDPTERLREANESDTWRPPEPYAIACVAWAEDAFAAERCKFNAVGRIAHHAGSERLRALLARMAPPRNVNTTFELKWAVESLPLRRQKRMLDSLFQVRFSHGASYVKHDVKSITEPEVLHELFERIVLSRSG
jgi:hypothetical protein